MNNVYRSLGLLFLASAIFALPKFVSAATIYLNPASANYSVGSDITLNVLVDTGGSSINAAQANVVYPPELLKPLNSKQGSDFYLATPGSLNQSPGQIFFSGAVPGGYIGHSGSLGTINFEVVSSGSIELKLDHASALLNDGFGTEALSATSGATFNAGAAPAPAPPLVSSSTNPDPNRWYPSSNVFLHWTESDKISGYIFSLDQNPTTVATGKVYPPSTVSTEYSALSDGVWYFHIRAKSLGSGQFSDTAHFKINIDTLAPKVLGISIVNRADPPRVSDPPIIQFQTLDSVSGIDYIQLSVDGRPVQTNPTTPYRLSGISQGMHIVSITAYDFAGNSNQAEMPVMVAGDQLSKTSAIRGNYFVWQVLSAIAAGIALICILALVLLNRRIKKWRAESNENQLKNEVEDLKNLLDTAMKNNSNGDQGEHKIKKSR